jgi:hypothetical protein
MQVAMWMDAVKENPILDTRFWILDKGKNNARTETRDSRLETR